MLGPNILRAGSSWLYPVHKGPLGVFLVSAFEALSWSQSISFFPDMLQRGWREKDVPKGLRVRFPSSADFCLWDFAKVSEARITTSFQGCEKSGSWRMGSSLTQWVQELSLYSSIASPSTAAPSSISCSQLTPDILEPQESSHVALILKKILIHS